MEKLKIVIIGAGQVGTTLAMKFSDEDHPVTVIDRSLTQLDRVKESLDCMAIPGNGASPDILREAGVDDRTLLLAVTNYDEINMLACFVGQGFGVRHKIARIRDSAYASEKNAPLFKEKLGIDAIINPEKAVVKEILDIVQLPGATQVGSFAGDRIQEAAFKADNPILHNKTLIEIDQQYFSRDLVLAAIHRGGRTIIPRGNDHVEAGDLLYLVGKPKTMKKIAYLISGQVEGSRRFMIYGGSRVGIELGQALEGQGEQVKLLEPDEQGCAKLSRFLNNSLIIKGEGTDEELLKAEGIVDTEFFIAATDSDEKNIVACLLARSLGARNVITLVGRSDYFKLLPTIGLPTVVSTHLATAGAILKFARGSQVLSVYAHKEGQSEVFEVELPENCGLIGKTLLECKFPPNSIVSAIVNNQGVTVPRGDTKLFARDRLIIFALPQAIPLIEEMLSPARETRFWTRLRSSLTG